MMERRSFLIGAGSILTSAYVAKANWFLRNQNAVPPIIKPKEDVLTANKRVTVNFTPNLVATATDQVAVTFVTGSGDIEGVASFEDTVIVARGGNLFRSAGSASNWTRINIPVYGTVLVNGGSQSGSTLAIDALTAAPQAGDTFTIANVAKVYTVTADATVSSGGSTININPAIPVTNALGNP